MSNKNRDVNFIINLRQSNLKVHFNDFPFLGFDSNKIRKIPDSPANVTVNYTTYPQR
jgi:hypothetical protein